MYTAAKYIICFMNGKVMDSSKIRYNDPSLSQS